MKHIRKIVCVHLNHKYLKNGYFQENEVFVFEILSYLLLLSVEMI